MPSVLIKKCKSTARTTLEALQGYGPESRIARAVKALETPVTPHAINPGQKHVDAAVAWIKRGHDITDREGVPWGFRARRPIRTIETLGWVGPYPETTGYIIPTMLRYGRLFSDNDAIERARHMTRWEVSIQLADGGIQGGIYGSQPVASSTFVTGQVLFGFKSAYDQFQQESVRTAARRAADWLCSCLDQSGRFVRGYSQFCAAGPKAYEARTGLALAEIADMLDSKKYLDAASRTADYALSVQQPNGWFAENDLDFHDEPLTHTIGYVLEGLHGIGVCLKRRDCLDAVKRTLDALLPIIQPNGFLAGRLRKDWSPAVAWVCLTGSAQIAGVYLRMYASTKHEAYLEAGRKLLGFVAFTQELAPGIAGIDGGIRGSYPFPGDYGKWCVLNWATKFFADSVMDYLSVTGESSEVANPSWAVNV
jgi:hypothetical protein